MHHWGTAEHVRPGDGAQNVDATFFGGKQCMPEDNEEQSEGPLLSKSPSVSRTPHVIQWRKEMCANWALPGV